MHPLRRALGAIYDSCYHNAARAIARIAHFLSPRSESVRRGRARGGALSDQTQEGAPPASTCQRIKKVLCAIRDQGTRSSRDVGASARELAVACLEVVETRFSVAFFEGEFIGRRS